MHLGLANQEAIADRLGATQGTSEDEVARYLLQILHSPVSKEFSSVSGTDKDVLERVYEALTQRRFCALSRGKARRYLPAMLDALADPFRRGDPLGFWLDIGPGYHASIRPGVLPLSQDVGLGEFLMLTQIAAFLDRVALLYPPGGRFRLVVDNLCALRTNEIPVGRTAGYCVQFRNLIEEMGLAKRVSLFVESEEFDLAEYDALLRDTPAPLSTTQPSQADIENVERFLGRRCTQEEAAAKIRLYQRTSAVTEHLMGRVVRGVRLTQRATSATLGFRSYPGGDARIQCGEVALERRGADGIVPVLLTSRNIDLYECARLTLASLLPSTIRGLTIASRRT